MIDGPHSLGFSPVALCMSLMRALESARWVGSVRASTKRRRSKPAADPGSNEIPQRLDYNYLGANPMTAKTLMTVEEYLHTSFEDGDCEYLDGEILEKNMGEYGHADIQGELVFLLRSLRSKPGLNTLKAMPEVRIPTGPSPYPVSHIPAWLKSETGV